MDLKEVGCGLDSAVSGQGPVAGCCEHGYEPLGFHKRRRIVDQLSYSQRLFSMEQFRVQSVSTRAC